MFNNFKMAREPQHLFVKRFKMYKGLHIIRCKAAKCAKIFTWNFHLLKYYKYLAIVCSARTSYVVRTQLGLISGILNGFKENKRFPFIVIYFFGVIFFLFHKLHELTRALVACARVLYFRVRRLLP